MNATKIKELKIFFLKEHQLKLTTQDIYHLASIEEPSLLGYELLVEYNCALHKDDLEYLFDLLST